MGMDISFNKKKALAAGIVIEHKQNGTKQEILDAIAHSDCTEYIAWLKASIEVFKIPETERYVEVCGGIVNYIVRANKWGHTYAPLTTWLKKHGINWSEF